MATTIKTNQQITLTVSGAVDSDGLPAPLPGVPSWFSSGPTFLTVTPATDGLSAVVRPTGLIPVVAVTISAVVSGLPGVSVGFAIVSVAAVTFSLIVGAPVPLVP